MKINIAASHRFHLLDLARELEQLGHDVRFYSYVPTKRCMSFGLSKKACKWMWWIIPTFLLKKMFRNSYWPNKLRLLFMDNSLSFIMPKCDVFIALAGAYVNSAKVAKKRGAKVILERGSKHILEQKRILESIPSNKGKTPVPDFNVKRNLQAYEVADYIAVASQHVKDSFVLHNYQMDKLFVNPYGVDLSMFEYLPDVTKKYDVVMVGGWSYRKGCDVLVEVVKRMGVSLLHVGSMVDCEFPKEKQFTHIDAVDQRELVHYYNQGKVFVLPSREEGLAMVQMQAVSCNLPLICSKHSGGEDLKKYFPTSNAFFVMDTIDVDCLCSEIEKALNFVQENPQTIYYDMAGKEQLTWTAYGKRYDKFIKSIVTCQ